MITPASRLWLRLYGHYKKQFLPLAGGILDQSAKYTQAMEVLDATFGQIEVARIKRAHEESERRFSMNLA